jgi:hypothetical protein
VLAALTFNDLLTEFLIRARLLRVEEEEPVPLDDPQRDPNWCHAHNQMQPCDGCRR